MEIKKFKLFEQEISLQQSTNDQDGQQVTTTDTTTQAPAEQVSQSEDNSTNVDISKFFSKLFEARQMAHVYHLTVKGDMGSHAAHTALGDFYDGLLDFIDNIIEVYQGQYGIIEKYGVIDTKEANSKDKVQYFEELANFIKMEKKCIKPEDSHLLNIVDEIVAHIYGLLYKLKFNK